METNEFQDVVLDIYKTIHEPENWQRVLDRLTKSVDARGSILFEWKSIDGQSKKLTAPLFSSYYQQATLDQYLEKHASWERVDQDGFEVQSALARSKRPDQIVLVNDADLEADEEAYLAQPNVQDLLSFGIRHRYGCLLDMDNPYRARFAIQTGQTRGKLSEEDKLMLSGLLPHLAKALDLGSSFGPASVERRAFLDVISRLQIGVCLLDQNGHVVEKNPEFERQMSENQNIWVDRSGKLSLHGDAQAKHFHQLLETALNHGIFGARPRKEAIMLQSDDGASSLCVELVPPNHFSEFGTSNQKYAVMLSRDTKRPISIDLEMAERSFSFTPAEASVTELVCKGLTNSEIAEQRERSKETVNAQVKSILNKTGTHNRTQLVRLLCNFADA
ncbi:helix-turn-helix transcriptional regulator [Planktotalea sp.]|uniref:helix-turn-helix transcriptional regulator n=1 Tax=Planktotalea sp. TaxID=2029877 RepID=UPI003D6AFE81